MDNGGPTRKTTDGILIHKMNADAELALALFAALALCWLLTLEKYKS